jgi:hypothetical protein
MLQTLQVDRLSGRFHRLADPLLAAQLHTMILEESDGTPWWALILRQDGQLHKAADPRICRTDNQDGVIPPGGDKQRFARDLVVELNRRAAYDGAWVVFWCEGADHWARLAYLWKDRDGDKQVLCDTDDVWPRVRAAGVDKWVEDGDAAVRKWHLVFNKALAVHPDQQFRKALGQRAPARR